MFALKKCAIAAVNDECQWTELLPTMPCKCVSGHIDSEHTVEYKPDLHYACLQNLPNIQQQSTLVFLVMAEPVPPLSLDGFHPQPHSACRLSFVTNVSPGHFGPLLELRGVAPAESSHVGNLPSLVIKLHCTSSRYSQSTSLLMSFDNPLSDLGSSALPGGAPTHTLWYDGLMVRCPEQASMLAPKIR